MTDSERTDHLRRQVDLFTLKWTPPPGAQEEWRRWTAYHRLTEMYDRSLPHGHLHRGRPAIPTSPASARFARDLYDSLFKNGHPVEDEVSVRQISDESDRQVLRDLGPCPCGGSD